MDIKPVGRGEEMQEFFKKIQNMDIVTKMTIVGALVILFVIVTVIIVTFSGGKEVVDDVVPIGQETDDMVEPVGDDTPKDFARIIAVVSGVDGNNGLLSITNVESYAKAVVTVPATLDIQDAFGESMALNQVYVGDLIEVKYDKDDMQAYEIKISNQGWEKASNRNMVIDQDNKTITLYNDTYFYTDDLILSFGDEIILISEIDPADDLTVRGYKDTVWSISLKNKHGYLVLENTASFIGGMV
jgi:hypothetical protein